VEKARYRPHHLLCERFLRVEIPDRGEEFERVSQGIKETLERQGDLIVEVIEGIDELCRVCPERQDERCQNPRGNEETVRKWDSIILRGLGINYGEAMASKDWRILIHQKAPLAFCKTWCPFKSECTVFQLR
jgi:hypothetical protein